MDNESGKPDKGIKLISAKCKKCGREYIDEDAISIIKHGYCRFCLRGMYVNSNNDYVLGSDIEEEAYIAGLKLKKGDEVEVMVGRNKTIIGFFKSWSSRLFSLLIETVDGDVLIPYKHIKMLLRRDKNVRGKVQG